jgi:iron complex outermembrane recepter protein
MITILKNIGLFSLLHLSLNLFGQEPIITGVIQQTASQPSDGAIVSLLLASDSTLVKSTISDAAGNFQFIAASQPCFITVQQVGFQLYVTPIISGGPHDFGPMQLLPNQATELKQVSIVGQLPFVVKKVDRYVVQPDALLSSAGNTALEILEKSPGVQVDVDGNISLRGQQGVLIFIDDRPTYLSPSDLANYLRSLSASSIQRIEIMTNPPARYDAAGSAGIINIILKKNKAIGTNGGFSLSYGQGRYMRSNNSFNINKRVDQFNWYGNLSHGTNNSYHDLTINRTYLNDQHQFQNGFDQNTMIKRINHSANGKVGVDYYPNKHSVLGVALGGFYNYSDEMTRNSSILSDSLHQITNQVHSITPAIRDFYNYTVHLNYQWNVDTVGTTLNINADYADYRSVMDQTLTSTASTAVQDSASTHTLRSTLPSDIKIYTAKTDLSKPFHGGWRWELGAKSSFVATANDAQFYDVIGDQSYANTTFSNRYTYLENINAGYTSLSRENGRWGYQLGLRYEGTRIEGRQRSLSALKDSIFSLNYDGLFPTAYMTYQIDTAGQHVVGLNYGRRINRPNYQDLNPFTYPLDPYTLYSGNPFLRPSFSHELECSYTRHQNWTITGYGGLREDEINETIEQVNPVFYSRPGNIGESMYFGFSLNGAQKITKWWTLQFYAEWMHNAFRSNLYGQKLANQGSYFYLGPNNQFLLSAHWSAELSGSYQTSVYSGQFVLVPVGSVRAAVAKKIWKDQGTLKMSLNDVFYTNQPGGDIKGIGLSTASWSSYLDTRVISFALSYRFSKGAIRANRSIGANDSESQRVH